MNCTCTQCQKVKKKENIIKNSTFLCVQRERGRQRVKGGREREQELFRGSWEGKGGKGERKCP